MRNAPDNERSAAYVNEDVRHSKQALPGFVPRAFGHARRRAFELFGPYRIRTCDLGNKRRPLGLRPVSFQLENERFRADFGRLISVDLGGAGCPDVAPLLDAIHAFTHWKGMRKG